MSDDDFDPYYLWLGIPPAEQPPNHYRLLGIVMFESNRTVIETAADRQMSFLRQYGTGPHGEESQKVLNEVSQALVNLLNPTKKAAYDERLKKQIDQEIAAEKSSVPVPIETPAAPAFPFAFDESGGGPAAAAPATPPPPPGVSDRPAASTRKLPNLLVLVAIAGVVSILAGAALGSLFGGKEDEELGQGTVVVQSDSAGSSVQIDGKDIDSTKRASPLTLDEGRHTAELRRNGAVVAAASFWVVAGNETILKLNEPKAAPAPVKAPTPATTKTSVPSEGNPTASKPTESSEKKTPVTEVAKVDPRPTNVTTPDVPPRETPVPESPKTPDLATTSTTPPSTKPVDASAGEITLREIRRIPITEGNIDGLALSRDGGLVAAQIFSPRAQAGAVRVWATTTGKEERHSLPTGLVNPRVRFSEDGTRYFYINSGKNQPSALSSFILKTGKSINVATLGGVNSQRPTRVTSYAISADDSTALFALSPQFNDQSNPVAATAVWDLKKKREIKFTLEAADDIGCVALSADGSLAAATFRAHRNSKKTLQDNVRIWDVKTRDVLYSEKFEQPTDMCHGLHFTTDGTRLIVAGPDSGHFAIIDVASRTKIGDRSFSDWRGSAQGIAFVPGTPFAIASAWTNNDAPDIRLLDYRGGRSLSTVSGDDINGDELAVSDDGSTLASGGKFAPLILWRIERR